MYLPVCTDRLASDVEELTSLYPRRNYLHPQSLQKAADHLAREFGQLSCAVEFQEFKVHEQNFKNVIASFGKSKHPKVVVGAHYDVCGDTPGADDNASGVAGLLETARLLSTLKPALNYGLDLVAYALEEPPFFRTPYMGSAVHASSLARAKIKVKLMVCLEMIGYFTDLADSQNYPLPSMKKIYPQKGNFLGMVGTSRQKHIITTIKNYFQQSSAIPVQTLSASPNVEGIDFSDHLNFWNHGFNAIMLTDTAFYRNPNYHTPGDTIETLDFLRMAEVVKGLYWAIIHL